MDIIDRYRALLSRAPQDWSLRVVALLLIAHQLSRIANAMERRDG